MYNAMHKAEMTSFDICDKYIIATNQIALLVLCLAQNKLRCGLRLCASLTLFPIFNDWKDGDKILNTFLSKSDISFTRCATLQSNITRKCNSTAWVGESPNPGSSVSLSGVTGFTRKLMEYPRFWSYWYRSL